MKLQSSTILGATLLNGVVAFPALLADEAAKRVAENEIASLDKRASPPNFPTNPLVATTFNAEEQYVSTSGQYKFVAPGPGDQRGPCPGLNALANHGYLPHNGIGTIDQFIQSTYDGFGMGRDLGSFLGVYGAIFDGDLTAWSIGFASKQLPVISGLLGTPQGIGGSHNNYENDASPMRGDLYTYGNSYLTQVSQFQQFYDYHGSEPTSEQNYDINDIALFRKTRFDNSIASNPYFFNAPFSGALASPAAYTFIFRFMANKSAENPEGQLNGEVLKTFYSITGESGNFKYTPGHERFPDNWYKRAIASPYSIPFFSIDATNQVLYQPEFLSVGGNTGKVNTFAGIDPGNLTGGVYELSTIGQGNNAACYGFELALQTQPSLLEGLYVDVTPAENMFAAAIQTATAGLGCKKLASEQYNQKYKQYPGYADSYDDYKGLSGGGIL